MLSHAELSAAPWTVAYQAPLSMEIFKQEYCSGLPFPSSEDLPDPGIKPVSLVSLSNWQADSLLLHICEVSDCLYSHQDFFFPDWLFSSAESLSCVRLFVIPWRVAHQASFSITNSWSLLKLMSIELVMPSNHLILSCPLLLLPSIFPSIRVFSSESVLCIMWPKYWSFSSSTSLSNEYSGLIAFRMDWMDLLAVQGILKNLLQHHSSKA